MAESQLNQPDKLLVIGGSTGSLDVLLQVLPRLHKHLAFPIIIVLHRKNSPSTTLADLLHAKTGLPVKEADDKEMLQSGMIYLAPADYHLLVEQEQTLALDDSEKVNFSRPSIDVTFESAAEVFKTQLTCLLLSGANEDGTAGLQTVKAAGGQVWIQNPETADVGYMPRHALKALAADRVVEAGEIADYINSL